MDAKKQQLLNSYKETGLYNPSQLEVITAAIALGLNRNQIDIMCHPHFQRTEMEQVYLGFLSDLTIPEIQLYAKAELDFFQMMEVRFGFQHHLDFHCIQKYATPLYNSRQMRQIRLGYEDKLTESQMQHLLNPTLNDEQMRFLRLGFQNGLTDHGVAFFTDKRFVLEQLEEILLGYEHRLNFSEIQTYAKPELHYKKMRILREAMEKRFTPEQIHLLSRQDLSYKQLLELSHAIDRGYGMEEVSFLANPAFSHEKIAALCDFFAFGYTVEDLEHASIPLLSDEALKQQLIQIRKSRAYKEQFRNLYNLIDTTEQKNNSDYRTSPQDLRDRGRTAWNSHKDDTSAFGDWIIADPDYLQLRRMVNPDINTEFELIQIRPINSSFFVAHGTVNISDYSEQAILDILHAFGFESAVQLAEKTGSLTETNGQIAEMLFELFADRYYTNSYCFWNEAVSAVEHITGRDLSFSKKEIPRSLEEQIQDIREKLSNPHAFSISKNPGEPELSY